MDVKLAGLKFKDLVVVNGPTILTAIGVTGTATTAVLAARAGANAQRIINYEVGANPEFANRDPEAKEIFQMVWKEFIPATVVGVFTIAATIGSNHIGTKRAAAVAAAYTLSEKAWHEYKDKVIEKVGKNKEQGVRDEIAQDHIDLRAESNPHVFITGAGKVRFLDKWSGRFFDSDMETVKQAQNDINYKILRQDYASLSDFYNKLGLPNITESDYIGWCAVNELEIQFSTGTTEDGRVPVHVIDFRNAPETGFDRMR